MKASKAIKFGLGGLVALVVLAACGLHFAGPSILEKVLAHANEISQKSTGKSLAFATPPSFSIMPLGVSFEGVRWGDDASDLSVHAKSGRAKVSLGSIFSGTPQVQEVVLQSPVVLVREAASQTALGPVAGEAGERAKADGEKEEATGAGMGPLPIQLERLLLQDGTFTLSRAGGDEVKLSKVNLSVRNVGQDEVGQLECDFVAAIRKASGEYMEANLAVQGSFRPALPRVGLNGIKVTLTPVTGIYDKALGPSNLSVAGSFDLDAMELVLDEIEAACAGAKARAKARLDLNGKNWQSAGAMDSMNLDTLQKLVGQSFGVLGTVSLDWDVTASGMDSDELMKSAAGKGQLVATNISVPGVTRAIKETHQLAGLVVPERVDRVLVPFTLGDGHARFTTTVTGKDVSGKGQGDASLVGQRVDATAEIAISGVTVPLRINGPFSDVSVRVDVEKLLKTGGKDLVEGVEDVGKGLMEDVGKLNPEKDLRKVIPGKGGNLMKGIF